ncbi:ATP-binding protein [Taylorella equigenitalis]|uniref:ATP-binding protein n=1 Tax=Taylorella equigenitalis TaxID=29575 RepID=UPI00240CF479|nr:ATP-binding protein [Taylorella equigenitalis]WFE04994.1 ATP-binding protein [Taylorella equigenitalis]WFE06473.1 ATP-binding protein [Taylorella equigenitalis]WFE07954.1 ATP-binding protein [Taylorella equigenitalis]WFE12389.1 ATP-binding protein [Taylorella equigenitalis]WGQ24442.1 ATP-binding protein [Taylorella equigenitalis]
MSRRYEKGSIMMTSNLPFRQWTNVLVSDHVLTSAVLVRVLPDGTNDGSKF